MTASSTGQAKAAFRVSKPTRREAIAGGIILAATAASQTLRPTRIFDRLTREELSGAIPKVVGPYRFSSTSGLILPPRDELSEKLYDQVLTRVYEAPDAIPVLALFAYGSVQNLSLELHRPDECYPQQGFVITDPKTISVQLGRHDIPASFLTATRKDGYVEQVLFWSRIGQTFPADRVAQSLVVARENFSGRMPDGLLARISVPTRSPEHGLQIARSFLQQLVNALAPVGQRIVLGDIHKGVQST